jgi:hypothetical protein
MKIDELTEEMIEEAKKCKTFETRRKFIEDNKIELSPDLLDGITGGSGGIDTGCEHEWEFIRRDKGVIWGYNNIYECKRCGEIWIEWDD